MTSHSFVQLTEKGSARFLRRGEIAARAIIDPGWNYRPELQDLLKYHRFGGWAIPRLVAFPGISKKIVEGLGGMLRPNSKNSVYKTVLARSIMPAISAIVPLLGSLKFMQRAALGIVGK